jgi:hypothetical protein
MTSSDLLLRSLKHGKNYFCLLHTLHNPVVLVPIFYSTFPIATIQLQMKPAPFAAHLHGGSGEPPPQGINNINHS